MKSSFVVYLIPCVLVLVLGLFATGVMPIKCYICDNVTNKGECEHGDIDKKFLKDCNDEAQTSNQTAGVDGADWKLCRKIITWIDFNVGENKATERVMRRCGHVSVEKYDQECYYRGGFGGRQRVCTCMDDACNAAPTVTLSSALLLTTTAVLFSFKSLIL